MAKSATITKETPGGATGGSSKRAVIYLRVSTTKQADKDIDPEGYSLPAQRDACMRKAEELGAEVVEIYMDRGESAKTANRPRFQEMLAMIQANQDIDYVILDKVNRFARNRRDDANVLFELRAAGCQLISVKENIDESPAGMLLHGIMATLAEYESRNNGVEAIKGMTKKAQVGGTPGRAAIGYRNEVQMIEGRPVKMVSVDLERAPLVQWAFAEYATGQWTINTLTEALQAKGLRALPMGKGEPKPIHRSRVDRMLRNRYYTGVVTFRGIEYPGRHTALVSEELFERVQEVLQAHGRSGERHRKHHHYLKGTIFCDACGSRLCLMTAKGRYRYFFCLGRQAKRTDCVQAFMPVEGVEVAVADFYAAHVQLDPEACQSIREGLRLAFDEQRDQALPKVQGARKRREELEQQRRRVARGLVDGSLPTDLAREEQDRIRREVAEVQRVLDVAEMDFARIEDALAKTLEVVGSCHRLYLEGNTRVRRLCNQAFFHELRIRELDVEGADLVEPWRTLHDPAFIKQMELSQGKGRPRKSKPTASLNNDFLVHPTGQSSNLTPAAKSLLRRWKKGSLRWRDPASGRRITDRRGRNVAAVEKPQTSITPALRAELAARYEAGATIRELADWSGAHRETVVRHLVRAGVEFRRVGLTQEQAEVARQLYLDGATLVEIADQYSVAASTVRSCLLRQDVSRRPAARRRSA